MDPCLTPVPASSKVSTSRTNLLPLPQAPWPLTAPLLQEIRAHKAGVLQVAYTPNGGLMISLGADGAVCTFDSHANYAISHRLPGQSVSGQPPCLCVSADSATLALTVPDMKADKV